MAAPRPFTDLNEPVFWDKNNKRPRRNSTILSSGLHQIWRLFTKLYSAVYIGIGRKRGNGKAIVSAAARMLHVAYLILKKRRKYHE